MVELLRNSNFNVVVTGHSSGIGKAVYDFFSDLKLGKVLGFSRTNHFDLSAQVGRIEMMNVIKRNCPEGIDLLVNNAGVMFFDEECERDFQLPVTMMSLNLLCVWELCSLAPQFMRQAKNSCIINIASVSAHRPDEDLALYSATKAGVIALTRAFAKKYAKYGIRVNSISPGFFHTNLCGGEPAPEELVKKAVPLNREADPGEILPVISMLVESEYITGGDIVIDGGMSA